MHARAWVWGILAAVLGAALAIALFADAPGTRAPSESPAPTPAPPTTTGAPEPTVLYAFSAPPGRAAGQMETMHVIVVRPGDARLNVTIERVGQAAAPANPDRAFRLIDPAGDEAYRCETGECAWLLDSPATGFWRIGMQPGGGTDDRVRASIARAAAPPAEEVLTQERRTIPSGVIRYDDAGVVAPGQTGLEISRSDGAGAACGVATARATLINPSGDAVGAFDLAFTMRNAEPGAWMLDVSPGGCDAVGYRVVASSDT